MRLPGTVSQTPSPGRASTASHRICADGFPGSVDPHRATDVPTARDRHVTHRADRHAPAAEWSTPAAVR